MNFNEKLEQYANVIIGMGIQVNEGQPLVISADVRDAEFVQTLTKKAYEKGASEVMVDWSHTEIKKLFYENVSEEVLTTPHPWLKEKYQALVDMNAAYLSIRRIPYKSNKDLDPSLMRKEMMGHSEVSKIRRDQMSKALRSWCLVQLPDEEWAEVVFPELEPEKALEKLWDHVFSIMRVDQEDPLQAWRDHASTLKSMKDQLNHARYDSLHFKSSTCDLIIDLVKDHNWQGGEKENEFKQTFIANMPTEEVHTMPEKTGVNGWVKNTKPLYINGKEIDDFKITFKDGQVTDYEAAVGEEVLKEHFTTDEGARYLGEVAIVTHSSPISQSGVIFKSTLYDENASCHLAFGSAYPSSLRGGKDMDEEQLIKAGANRSLTHVDFMIGSADLSIYGIKDDQQTLFFKNGEWHQE